MGASRGPDLGRDTIGLDGTFLKEKCKGHYILVQLMGNESFLPNSLGGVGKGKYRN